MSAQQTHETPKVCIQDLADYNNGILTFEWIELDSTDADENAEKIHASLKAMLERRTQETGELHEEHMIADYEHMPSRLGEYADIDQVAAIAAAINEHGYNPVKAFIDNGNEWDEDAFNESYAGEWDSEEAFGENLADDIGITQSIPENLRFYFDYEKWTRDLFLSGDYWSADIEGMTYVFRSV